jgi:maltooligosyltrehalose trehalohydrolase
VKDPEAFASIAAPESAATFEATKIRWDGGADAERALRLHRDLLRLRRTERVFARQDRTRIDGAVLNDRAFVLRYFDDEADALLVVNLGEDFELVPASEPLLAPAVGKMWRLAWTSEDTAYGGGGRRSPLTAKGWRLTGASAALLFETAERGFADG